MLLLTDVLALCSLGMHNILSMSWSMKATQSTTDCVVHMPVLAYSLHSNSTAWNVHSALLAVTANHQRFNSFLPSRKLLFGNAVQMHD